MLAGEEVASLRKYLLKGPRGRWTEGEVLAGEGGSWGRGGRRWVGGGGRRWVDGAVVVRASHHTPA